MTDATTEPSPNTIAELARWRELAHQLAEAIRLTREYVEPAVMLPAAEGWSWYDATQAYEKAVSEEARTVTSDPAIADRRDLSLNAAAFRAKLTEALAGMAVAVIPEHLAAGMRAAAGVAFTGRLFDPAAVADALLAAVGQPSGEASALDEAAIRADERAQILATAAGTGGGS